MNIRAKIFGGNNASDDPIMAAKRPKGARADELQSIAVSREARRQTNSRFEDRHRLAAEQARLTHDNSTHDVELINLSGGGAMVRGEGFEPHLWEKVKLCLGPDGTIECAVRWIKNGRVGLEFAHETRLDCSVDQQAEVLREVITRSFPELRFEPAIGADRGPPPEGEHRRAPRHPLIWSGVLHHDYQSTPVRVRNISTTGAMIESTASVRVGAEPVLELGGDVNISATVEWAIGDQVGLRFERPFDLSLLAATRPEVAPNEWKRPSYLESSNQPDSPWDPNWERSTLESLKTELEGFLKR
jgi:hypothetical protein